jgi:putative drug exporter of the RND superfamily
MTAWLYKLGKNFAKYGWMVVVVWLVIIVTLGIVTKKYGGQISNTFTLPGSNSQHATDIVNANFPTANNGSAQLVFHATEGTLDNPESQQNINELMGQVSSLHHFSSVFSPFADVSGNSGLSADKTIAYTTVAYNVPLTSLNHEDVEALTNAAEAHRTDNLQIELGGNLLSTYSAPDTDDSEKIGLIAAAFILLVTFGSVVAMGLPIISALTGLGIATMVTILLARFIDIPSSGPAVATMIGIGVGIDYALFIISRHREQLSKGMLVSESVARTIATSGQAVIVAGGTVIIANMGLLLVRIPIISAIAYATAIAVACAMLVSLTLLPAILALLGKRINSLAIPHLHKSALKTDTQKAQESIWGRLAHHVTNRPWRYIIGSLLLLALLITPVFSLKLGSPNPEAVPETETQRKAYDLLTEGFGVGINDPLLVAVQLPVGQLAQNQQVLQKLGTELLKTDNVAAITPPVMSENQSAALMTVIPKTGQNDPATTDLVHTIQNNVIASATAGTEAKAYVGGVAAAFIDITQQISDRMVLFISAVLLLTFLLLMIVFRSLFIPFKAVVMNLLSVLSAFGVVVALFQWGWGKDIINLSAAGPIVSYVPLMIFAILFGLSMDYEVFILSRVREEYEKTHDNKAAVVEGITRTSRLITAAALIMISVFMAFVISDDPVIKMFGVGLAFAVFIDATIIRLVLVPATMDLAGKANWWFPKRLKKLIPDMHFEDESVFKD